MVRSSPRPRRLAWVMVALTATLAGSVLLGGPGTPDIQVLDNTTVIPLNGSDPYSPTPVGVPRSTTFTVKNVGSGNLLVAEAITVPVGFTLMASFPGVPNALLPSSTIPAYTIAPGASATFTVALNSAMAGSYSGVISFGTNVSGKNPFTFNVSGRVDPPPGVRYTDDADAGFSATSGWTGGDYEVGSSGKTPYQGSLTYAYPGTGTEAATWSFTGLEPGQYRVSASWVGFPWGTTNAPYTVDDGVTPLGTVRVNQQSDATGFSDGGAVWQDLGVFTIYTNALNVTLTDDADSVLNADGVRIERVGYPGALLDDAGTGFTTTGSWTTGYTQAGAKYYNGSISYAFGTPTPGTPTATGTFTFTVTPGQYRVLLGFTGDPYASSNTPFSVYDGSTQRGSTQRVNLQSTPTDLTDVAVGWKDLGVYQINGTSLRVQLTNDADSWIFADAMRIERCNTPTVASQADTVRFLQQASWGPTPALITSTQNRGLNNWLNDQFAVAATSYPLMTQYSTNDNSTLNNFYSCYGDPTVTGNPARSACLRDNYQMYPLQNRFFTNALYGGDQLRQRVAWSQHKIWVISGVSIRQPSWVTPYLQILSNEAFTNYRTLMYKITLNAGMGQYLSMNGSVKAQPNENYPRELMQLFTIGLNELNPDGTNKLSGGVPIPTYDQAGVEQMTKVFTGWNIAGQNLDSGTSTGGNTTTTLNDTTKNYWTPNMFAGLNVRITGGTGINQSKTIASNTVNQLTVTSAWNPVPNATSTYVISGVPNYIDPMRLEGADPENPGNHDFTSKTLLRGFVQPARTSSIANAYADLNEALNNIYAHPNVAPFVSKQLIQSLVTSNPSPGYVARVSDTFTRNRYTTGTTLNPNQMREVIRAILLDPEARGDLKSVNNYGHLKEPVLYVNNLMRLFDARSDDRMANSDGYLNPYTVNMNQDVFNPASVFSYYSPGKVAVGGNPPVIGPEFQIQTTTTGLYRPNFVNMSFTPNSTRTIDVVRTHGTTPSGTDPLTGGPIIPTGALGTAVDVSWLTPLASNPPALVNQLSILMLNNAMTNEMYNEIVTAVNAVAASNPTKRVRTAVYLVASSSQYQVQR